jgi:hypothetical protein
MGVDVGDVNVDVGVDVGEGEVGDGVGDGCGCLVRTATPPITAITTTTAITIAAVLLKAPLLNFIEVPPILGSRGF